MTSEIRLKAKKVCFLTDVHLLEPNSPKTKIFCSYLERIFDENFEALILMGDIFDFFFAATNFHHQKYAQNGDLLRRIANNCCQVFFIQGNHEFCLTKLRWDFVKVVTNETLVWETGSKTIVIAHGDKFSAPLPYLLYLSIVSSKPFQWMVSLLPSKWLDELCLSVSSASRAKDDHSSMDHKKILESAESWLKEHNGEIAIFGHFHIPYSVVRKSGKALISCHDWSKPNSLVASDGKFKRLYLDESGNVRFTKTLRITY